MVLRLIEQMGGLIRRALELLRVGERDMSYVFANEAIGLAIGMDPEAACRFSPQALTSMLELSHTDDRMVELLAEALGVQAMIAEQRGAIAEARLRAEQAAAVRSLLDPSRAN
jgi:hypothetical protein